MRKIWSKEKLVLFTCFLGCLMLMAAPAFAADDLLVNTLKFAKDIVTFIRTLANYAVIVGVGIGALMVKFSGGNDRTVATGKTVIKSSIIAWVILFSLPMILDLFSKYGVK